MGVRNVKIKYPASVRRIICILEGAGHEAYAVGGCIRDSLMGRVPDDWDITTSATPDEMLRIFEESGLRTYTTGLKHGTITVLCGGEGFECTTYRTEAGYSDGRHPDKVSFSRSLADDLCRRDFTINAMAGNPMGEIVDPYGGGDDIKNKILRCVGEPSVRFGEDALRILRAVRFATVLGFKIDPLTASAIAEKRDMLVCVSDERKSVEFCKTIMSDDPDRGLFLLYELGLMEYILPDTKRTKIPLAKLPKKLPLRLSAVLLECPEASLGPLKLSNAISSSVKRLLVPPSCSGEGEIFARILMHKYGELAEDACLLYGLSEMLPLIACEREKNACASLSGLSVGGDDLKGLGYTGKDIRDTLELLLLEVIRNPELNEKNTLLRIAEKHKTEGKKCTE